MEKRRPSCKKCGTAITRIEFPEYETLMGKFVCKCGFWYLDSITSGIEVEDFEDIAHNILEENKYVFEELSKT